MVRFSLRLIVALLIALAPQTASATSNQCDKFRQIISLVDLTNRLIATPTIPRSANLNQLATTLQTVSMTELKANLGTSGQARHIPLVSAYLADLYQILQIHQTNGPQLANWLLRKTIFQDRHAEMFDLSRELCTSNTLEHVIQVTNQDLGLNQAIGSNVSNKEAAELSGGRITATPALSSFSINKEAFRLMQVFFLLAVAIICLIALGQILKIARAIHLDRYACTIPATLLVEQAHFPGHIEVLGNRGLSFRCTGATTSRHTDLLTQNAQARFVIKDMDISAVLTKPFDGSAGFRLSVPLKKAKLQRLLDRSTSKPRRKIEMRDMKKPAKPIKASLASNSRAPRNRRALRS